MEHTDLLASRSFHFLASPEELFGQVSALQNLRAIRGVSQAPTIIWEPRPSSCTTDNQQEFFKAISIVDIFSPNHIECANIFKHPSPELVQPDTLEKYAASFLQSGVGQYGQGAVVIRAGEQGCLVMSNSFQAQWIQPYYEILGDSKTWKVVDPTGAGNAFLGAFAIGLIETKDLYHSACYGNVGASFALEQIGLPTLENINGRELWNKADVSSRLRDYMARLGCKKGQE
jgi:sugar/nucleoside kinase (ribokinase family)